MFIKQISAFVENRPGRIAEITEILASHNIDLRALSVADTTDFGILRIIVDHPDEVAVLLRESRVTVTLTDVLAIKLPDKPGALSNMLRLLADSCVSVEYLYAFVTPTDSGAALVVLRADDIVKAEKVLQSNGYKGMEEAHFTR